MIEHSLSEIFVAWFIWRCSRFEIISRWTKAVAKHIAKELDLDVAEMAEKYGFEDGMWEEFIPKQRGMYPND